MNYQLIIKPESHDRQIINVGIDPNYTPNQQISLPNIGNFEVRSIEINSKAKIYKLMPI